MGQQQSYILGSLGLIPFIIIILLCFISPPDDNVYSLLIFIYIAYAAVISSFLAGIQWGLITSFADKIYYVFIPLSISVMPPLISWVALLLLESQRISLSLILVSFLLISFHDYYLYQQLKITPLWFIRMRLILSAIVIILTSLLFIYTV